MEAVAAPDTFCYQGIARAVIQVTSAEVIYGMRGTRAYMVTVTMFIVTI